MSFESLATAFRENGVPFLENEPMNRHTTFKIGGPARIMACPFDTDSFASAVCACVELGVPYHVIGNGSNLLVADEGLEAAVILTTGVKEPMPAGEGCISASAGESLSSLCNRACDRGLTGLEFAFGIPGSVGGAIYMNAGAYGGEISNVLREVYVFDPITKARKTLLANELGLGYRHSAFMELPLVILGASFSLESGDKAQIQFKMQDFMSRRKTGQPLDRPSAGSAFKRPAGAYAAALIDRCGLKGYRVGGAMVSEKHAGFIINEADATCADVLALMDDVGRIVRENTGYVLEPEIRLLNT